MTDDNLARERENEEVRRVVILTDGESAPGLNALLEAFVLAASGMGMRVYGSSDGFAGLIEKPPRVAVLTPADVREARALGGSLLGCASAINPFDYESFHGDDISRSVDVSGRVVESLDELGIDALVLVGSHGTLEIAARFAKIGVPVIGLPSAIDNDLAVADLALGLDTAVHVAASALDGIRDASAPHPRLVILEAAGHHAGWTALMAGIVGGADVVLIPEIAYDVDRVLERIRRKDGRGQKLRLVIVAEGSKPLGGTVSKISDAQEGLHDHDGPASQLARLLEGRVDQRIEVASLTEAQRSAAPSAGDRLLAARLGVHAAELCHEGHTGRLVTLHGPEVGSMPIEAAISKRKRVSPDGELAGVARALGIELGQE